MGDVGCANRVCGMRLHDTTSTWKTARVHFKCTYMTKERMFVIKKAGSWLILTEAQCMLHLLGKL